LLLETPVEHLGDAVDVGLRNMMRWVVVPLLINILLDIVLLALGKQNLAMFFGYAGPIGIFTVCVIWIVFYDSKRRWPNNTAWERFNKLISFTR